MIAKKMTFRGKMMSLNVFSYFDPTSTEDIDVYNKLLLKDFDLLSRKEKKPFSKMKSSLKKIAKKAAKEGKSPIFVYPPSTIMNGIYNNPQKTFIEKELGLLDEYWYKSVDIFAIGSYKLNKMYASRSRVSYLDEQHKTWEVILRNEVKATSPNRLLFIIVDFLNINCDVQHYLTEILANRLQVEKIHSRGIYFAQYFDSRNQEVPTIDLF